jgi:adenylosuccinate synthase
VFHKAEPVYEEAEGWTEDLSEARAAGDLPPAARRYVARIAQLAGVPVRTVSVGPDREQTLTLED